MPGMGSEAPKIKLSEVFQGPVSKDLSLNGLRLIMVPVKAVVCQFYSPLVDRLRIFQMMDTINALFCRQLKI